MTRPAARNGPRSSTACSARSSLHWAGQPLRTWDTLLGYLRVEAALLVGDDPAGLTVSAAAMQALALDPHALCPRWNSTIRPRPVAATSVGPEVIP